MIASPRISPTILALASLLSGCASTMLPDGPVIAPKLFLQRDFRLNSGLRVVVQEDHGAPLIVVSAIYGTGATADPAGAVGLAHLVEHLTFRARLAGTPVGDWLKRAGATFNAFTRADSTLYYAVAQRSALSDLLQVEMWRMTRTLEGISPEEFQIERQVVVNEGRQQQHGRTGSPIWNQVQAQLFPVGHPLARPLFGTEETLAATTLPLARAFASEHYRPENCTLVIVGDVKWQQVAALMKEWPAQAVDAPEGSSARVRPHRPPLVSDRSQEPPPGVSSAPRTVKGPVARKRLVLAWSLPGLSSSNEALLATAGAAIQEAALVASAQAHSMRTPAGSMVMVESTLAPDKNVQEARTELLDRITSERSVTIARQATPVLRALQGARVLHATADPVSSALSLADHLASTGRPSFYKDTVEQILTVEPDKISALLRKYLTEERAVTLIVEPDPNVSHGSEYTLSSEVEQRHDLARSADASLAGMSSKEILRVARSPGIGALPRFQLANGLTVIAVERPSSPIAVIRMQLPGGDVAVSPYGLATLASLLSTSRCNRHTDVRFLAGTSSQTAGWLNSLLSIEVPEGNLANGLASLEDNVECRTLEASGFDAFEGWIELLAKEPTTAQGQARAAFREALYPGHPFGKDHFDVAPLRRVKRGEANDYVHAHFRPDAALAVVVSGRPVTEVRHLVEEFLADWKPSGKPRAMAPPPPPAPPGQRVVRVFDEPRKTQVQLRVGCRLPAVTSETAPVFEVLENVIAEQTNELRASWGITYGFQAAITYAPGAAHLAIEGDVDSAKVGAALARLLAMLARDATDGPDLKAFTIARWDVARAFNTKIATGAGIARAILFAAQAGLPAEVWDRYPVRLANTARTEVRDLLRGCPGHEVITLVGEAAVISKQLAAKGLK